MVVIAACLAEVGVGMELAALIAGQSIDVLGYRCCQEDSWVHDVWEGAVPEGHRLKYDCLILVVYPFDTPPPKHCERLQVVTLMYIGTHLSLSFVSMISLHHQQI